MEKIKCPCGKSVTISSWYDHCRFTNVHNKYLENIRLIKSKEIDEIIYLYYRNPLNNVVYEIELIDDYFKVYNRTYYKRDEAINRFIFVNYKTNVF